MLMLTVISLLYDYDLGQTVCIVWSTLNMPVPAFEMFCITELTECL